jgi:hypothetical protein
VRWDFDGMTGQAPEGHSSRSRYIACVKQHHQELPWLGGHRERPSGPDTFSACRRQLTSAWPAAGPRAESA